MGPEQRRGTRIVDRAEYRTKPAPLSFTADTSVAEAVEAMSKRNYGSVLVVGADDKLVGILTERDVMKRIVNEGRDPRTTRLGDVMTTSLRVAKETDDIVDWLRIMSNERFRRLPIVDNDGRPVAMFTQGDFVSYTWPDLMYQARQIAKATVVRNFPIALIAGGILIYSALMFALIRFV